MRPSTPAPDPEPAISPEQSLGAARGGMPSSEHEITVVLPDHPPVMTPLAAAALMRLLHHVQRQVDGGVPTEFPERSAA